MNTLRTCCSPPSDYKRLGKNDSDDRRNNPWGEMEGEKMHVPLRQEDDVVVRIDPDNNNNNSTQNQSNSGNGVDPRNGNEDEKGAGIWRGSSYDFMCKMVVPDMEGDGSSGEKSRSFDFRAGSDPPSKLIGDFLARERLSGQKSLDMDFDMEELRWPPGAEENDVSVKKRSYLATVQESFGTERPSISSQVQSECTSPQRAGPAAAGFRSSASSRRPHPFSSASPSSSMNARSPTASPKVQFESFEANSRVQIGSPVHEGGPRYGNKEDELDPESNSSSSRETPVGSGRKKSGGDEAEVLRCSSRAASPNLNRLRTKTKSRLIDPPPPLQYEKGEMLSEAGLASRRRSVQMRSGQLKSGQQKSGQLKSGMLGKNGTGMLERLEEEEDDPFKDEDLPDELKRPEWGFMALFQWICFIVIVGALVCSLIFSVLKKLTVWELHLWKWFLLVLVLFCGRLFSGWVIRIAVFFIERNFLLRKRVLYFVYGLRKAVQNCLWLGLVLLAWHYLFDKKVQRETKSNSLRYINKVLVCMLVGFLIWLVKTLLVKVLASSFHVNTYFDRIQESLFSQYVLETLSGPPLIEIEREERVLNEVAAELKEAGANIPIELKATASKSGLLKGVVTPRSAMMGKSGMIGKSGRSFGGKSGLRDDNGIKQNQAISIDHLHKLNQKNISAWNMKRLMNIVRHGVISTLDESFQASQEDESVTQIRSEWEARAAAKQIFRNVAQTGCKFITCEDLMRFLSENEALKAMSLFEGAQETNKVSKAALKNWVVSVFRERRALALTLNDTKTAVNKLHHMVNVVVSLIIVIIWLLILGIATTHLLVLISSQLLLVVFVFGNTCKMVFESIIFLFVMHPFDVGDRCSVDGVQMVVEEMNILTTVFLRYDNEKIWFPNTVLATKPISNFYRSPDMGDAVDFTIHIATPVEKVSIMKERIKKYVDGKQDHWYPNPMIVVLNIEEMNKMKMAVWLQHKMNHQDMGEKWLRRSHLVEEMINIFRDLDIEYRLIPKDVNVRNLPAITSTRLPSTWVQ